ERKGATYYAVAMGLLRIVESILRNQHTVLSISNLVPDYYEVEEVYLSLPAVVGRAGVERTLNLPLDNTEVAALRRSAVVLREALDQIENGG
ncbi:MAG: L-lactate dehydrogenase, partial [Anaerolineaceae bacterium]|nr:L-lactate dehydrogenase [Anaerolineaceae bacterium]